MYCWCTEKKSLTILIILELTTSISDEQCVHIIVLLLLFVIIKYFYLFYIPITVFPPSSLPIPLPSCLIPPLSSPFRKGYANHGSQQTMAYKLEQDYAPLPASRLGKASQHGK